MCVSTAVACTSTTHLRSLSLTLRSSEYLFTAQRSFLTMSPILLSECVRTFCVTTVSDLVNIRRQKLENRASSVQHANQGSMYGPIKGCGNPQVSDRFRLLNTFCRARSGGAGGLAMEEPSRDPCVAHGQASLPMAALAQRTPGTLLPLDPGVVVTFVHMLCRRGARAAVYGIERETEPPRRYTERYINTPKYILRSILLCTAVESVGVSSCVTI